MKIEALALALAGLDVELTPMDARTLLLRAAAGHARLTLADSDVLLLVDGAAGSLVLREDLALTGRLAELPEVETGHDEFDDRFLARGAPAVLDDADREALLALPPGVALTLVDGRLRLRVPGDADEATLAYALVRAWAAGLPDAFAAIDAKEPPAVAAALSAPPSDGRSKGRGARGRVDGDVLLAAALAAADEGQRGRR